MPTPRALLFDLDGTLSDTDAVHLPTWAETLSPHGVAIDETFFKENISGRTSAEIVRDLLPGLSDEEGRTISDAQDASFRERVDALEPLPGLLGFLSAAEERGLMTGLVTNAPRENVGVILPALKLQDFFDEVVISADVEAGKPDPAPYRAALQRLGVAPGEALAFEDSVPGVASAVGAGIPTVGVASTRDPEKLREAGTFAVVRDFADPGLKDLVGI